MNETSPENQISHLPKGWELTTIGEITEIVSGIGFPEKYQGKEFDDIPFFKVSDVSNTVKSGNLTLIKSKNYISNLEAKELKGKLIKKNTIVFAKIGEAIKLNRRAILGQDSLIDNNVMGLYCFSSALNHLFLYYFFLTVKLGEISQATTVPAVRKTDVEQISFAFPPLAEQERIVLKIEELFTKLEAGVSELKQAQAQLKRYRQSVLKSAVTGELTRDWRKANQTEPAEILLKRILKERREKWEADQLKKFAETGKMPKNDDWKRKYKEPAPLITQNLSKLPNGWAWASVSQLGAIGEQPVLTGPFGTNLGKNDFISGGVPVLTIGCLKLQGIELNKAVFISEQKASELSQYRLKTDDLLFSRMAAVGRAGIVPSTLEGSMFNYHIMRLRLAKSVLSPKLFVSYVRGSAQVEDYIKEVNHGATRDGINTEQLLNLPVSLPPLAEQEKIVEEVERLLSVADAVEKTIAESLKQAGRLRQSILQKAFTGKLVPQDEREEPASVLLERIKAERDKINAKKETKSKKFKETISQKTLPFTAAN